jgi:CRISPR-associated protein Cas5h
MTVRLVRFRYHGRVGHFLRAEMNASALSYPMPPRTALLGLVGNILGVAKDESPRVLADAAVAVRGKVPGRHYHRANVRKTFPSALPLWIKPARMLQAADEEPGGGFVSQVVQEWLLDPDFVVYVGSADPAGWIAELEERLRAGKTHFTPCLGPAWMTARVGLEATCEGEPLPDALHDVATVCRRSEENKLVLPRLADRPDHAVQEVRMPREVTTDRVFVHANYYLEMQGRSIPVKTANAWSFQSEAIIFL